MKAERCISRESKSNEGRGEERRDEERKHRMVGDPDL